MLSFPLASRPGVEVVILKEYPQVNSPLELRFFVRLRTAMNTSFTLSKQELNTILESFLRNISDTFGVEFTGNKHIVAKYASVDDMVPEYIFLNGVFWLFLKKFFGSVNFLNQYSQAT